MVARQNSLTPRPSPLPGDGRRAGNFLVCDDGNEAKVKVLHQTQSTVTSSVFACWKQSNTQGNKVMKTTG